METDPRKTSACFTGHRPDQLKGVSADELRLELQNRIEAAIEEGYTTFYCGMAMGTDILAGELTAALREQYPWVRLVAAIPFPEQSRRWPERWKARYTALLQKCDDAVMLLPRSRIGGYHLRNRYMVDRSSLLIGVYNGAPKGGTAYTVGYARRRGLALWLLRPEDYRR